ncbi:peptidoglycan-binding domain-containing protein [Dyella sp. 333MFSha]|uniref:peptidoglycan-binding domain-containing protein n=1 Tax=Dyella sp. 333MFSha TaxID=1798240 RepID=UPI00088F8312|nr:peptidoglycan-binding domain-containing protein [Dyella sp. 333MFSha]SDF40075.1 Peptidoglycan-binding (PGRP) domain of peptidoglycan hydrolases-containing protein [Dyella sp. 333MFSha]
MTDELERARSTAEQWHLGQTSSGYESGPAGAGAVSTGRGDHGGVSYGSYQLSSSMGTLQEYLDQSPYGTQFHGLTPVTPAFNAKWQELARTDPGFGRDQHDFVGRSHYSSQAAALQERGLDLSDRGMAVKDALWSTAVQCRDLTPNIFTKGLKEKFGEHYDLAALSDKQIVDAVQDYKIAHVQTLFSRSPELHESLKNRFANEKISLEHLAEADATLRANGVVVEHTAAPTPGVTPVHHAPNGAHAAHSRTLRLSDHSEAVGALQSQLSSLGYVGANGTPLRADNHFGPNTQTALLAFQRDHHLQADGIAGPRTLNALNEAQAQTHDAPALRLDHHEHAGHAMYRQAFRLVQDLDARQGRDTDHMSCNLAGSLCAQSRSEGMTRIDHLVLNDDASRAYAVQGDLNSPFKQFASVDIAQAVAQPLAQSSHNWSQADQQQQQQIAAPAQELHQQAHAAPILSR